MPSFEFNAFTCCGIFFLMKYIINLGTTIFFIVDQHMDLQRPTQVGEYILYYICDVDYFTGRRFPLHIWIVMLIKSVLEIAGAILIILAKKTQKRKFLIWVSFRVAMAIFDLIWMICIYVFLETPLWLWGWYCYLLHVDVTLYDWIAAGYVSYKYYTTKHQQNVYLYVQNPYNNNDVADADTAGNQQETEPETLYGDPDGRAATAAYPGQKTFYGNQTPQKTYF